MNEQKEYLNVNWIDGMKINKTHFISDQQAGIYRDALGNAIVLNDHNYGLLPLSALSTGTKLFLSVDNQQSITLRVMDCRLVTRGGYVVVMENDTALSGLHLSVNIPDLSVPFERHAGKTFSYYIVLSVNPYERVAAGIANMAETPTRLPYVMPRYSLHLLPVDETSSNTLGYFQVPVGKLVVDEQRVSLEDDYIPPCSSVNSFPGLLEAHAGLELFFGKMELWALQILQKILQKKQDNDLAIAVQKICENVLSYTASQTPAFRLAYLYQPPAQMIAGVSGFARLIKNSFDIFLGTIKEELINYLTEWCGVSQGEVEGTLTALCSQPYDHLEIKTSVEKMVAFTNTMSLLFSSLAGLDYIGKKRETGIFVKEQAILPDPDIQEKRRNSFLAE